MVLSPLGEGSAAGANLSEISNYLQHKDWTGSPVAPAVIEWMTVQKRSVFGLSHGGIWETEVNHIIHMVLIP